ncbi:uncharacterized protein LOC128200069 isoform X2 [Galleria mellonella]|uniref:Uncharacterized protein LOC128200069 isoform X2 n=1 Tax=Galleria mellonella TaxID=7137 RepID=A0ABM3M9N0_GALME|nr:uncharacterized protein LOC128200069 isoform X2 [Galleria mellonella]
MRLSRRLGVCVYRHLHRQITRADLLETLEEAKNNKALVKVLDVHGKPHAARVLLDNGSTGNFVTKDFCGKLNLRTHATNSRVTGINHQVSTSSLSCSLTLESYVGGYRTDINCFVLPTITTLLPNTYIDIHNLKIPPGVCLADPNFNVPSTIDILVGADVFWSVIGTNRIQLGTHKPTLFETKFGWLVSGTISQSDPKQYVCMFSNNLQNNSTDLTRFWELDTISSKYELTPDEHACEQDFMNSTQRNKEGRFVVSMPLREPPEVLGNSYSLAKNRFLSLERRLQRESHLKRLYVEFIKEYIDLGHMSENTFKNHNQTIQCYLPHHGILKTSNITTQLRVVFDGSASTSSGKSLNDIQRVGPTMQDDLLSILLRFRQHKFVVSADIEKMYRQILLDDAQRPLQKILWRFDPSHPLKSYTLNTLTYGTASAPFLATRCLTQLGHDSNNSEVKRAICHDFYVDDFLSGHETIEDTISLCQGVINTLQSAKFNLRKWHSNNSTILNSICQNNKRSGSVDLSAKECAKTLGIHWKCLTDHLSFSINISSQDKLTKRFILSTISQVFDPLGLVSPCIVEAKILMQQLWINKCSWDDKVPPLIEKIWSEFVQFLPLLNNLKIPRCIKNNSTVNTEIHIFTDASEKAYGTCVYIRSISSEGSIDVRLLVSKNKVAPIKITTIPRLELCGALLGARLYKKVITSVTLEFSRCVFWTDSTIVLGWIASSPSQLKPFVRHRVVEIQEGSHEWRYVPSKSNPADLVSRGLRADLLNNSSLWWSGPSFLKLDSSQWPLNPNKHNSNLPETIQSFHTDDSNLINNKGSLISSLIDKFSNFTRLQRVVAFVLRFVNNCQKNTNKLSDQISLLELNNAAKLLLRTAQQDSFPEERELLLSNKQLPFKNRLVSLSPFIDFDNLIRVGGRLNDSHYDYNVKHPILLSGKHRLCELIFNMLHKKFMHSGPQLLLATARHNYWPIGGLNLAKRIVRSCVRCTRFKGKTIQPMMGNLPEKRVHLEFPFLETGVDYAGPVLIADRKGRGCKIIKSYICVFVCFATKAAHLELVSDLTKEAFIAALNRFIARRGKPQTIFSDNGTTFVGTFHELSKLLKQSELSTDLAEQGINFSFIPAYTPHFGGLWESLVRSTKHLLRRILDKTHLNYEEMATLLIQIEAILNSRPITPISDNPSDIYPLTPAHFLIGRSIIFLPHPEIVDRRFSSLQRFQRIELLKQHFWNRFSNEYVVWLQQKTKWHRSYGELKEGTLVVIKEKTSPPLMWLMGRVIRIIPGRDGIARVADIQTKKGVMRRAYNTICPLPVKSFELDTSTRGVYGQAM